MSVDLNAAVVFVRVVEHGGFTAAAAALGVPKSTVSRSVKRLEEELGARLLQRTSRAVRLTEAGRGYFETASRALAGLEEAAAAVHDEQASPRGVVRVTAAPDVGAALLAPIVARFVRAHPGVRVELLLTSRMVDLVQEGVDLAVRMGKLRDSSLVVRPLGTIGGGLFASKAYLARAGAPARLSDLAGHACLLFRGQDRWTLAGPRGAESVEVSGPVSADDMAVLREAAAHGAGIALLPFVAAPGAGARLVRVLPAYEQRGAPAQLVYPSARFVPRRVQLLRDAILAGVGSAWFAARRAGG